MCETVLDIPAVLAALPADERLRLEGDDFRAACAAQWEASADALAAIPDHRRAALGVAPHSVDALLSKLRLPAELDLDAYVELCRWAQAESVLQLATEPVVGAVLPAGDGRDGLEAVQRAGQALELAAGRPWQNSDTLAVKKLTHVCLPTSNPSSFRTCAAAGRGLAPELLAQCPRVCCLEALAALAGSAAGAQAVGAGAATVLRAALAPARPVDERLAAVGLCAALAGWPAGSCLRPVVPALGAAVGDALRPVRAAALSVLAQLSFRPALVPGIAAVLAVDDLADLLVPGALQPCDLLDAQLLVLNLLPDGRLAPALARVVRGGGLASLAEALRSAQHGEEFPRGSGCFRRVGGLCGSVLSACRAGLARELRPALPVLVDLARVPEHGAEAVACLRALAASTRNAELLQELGAAGEDAELDELLALREPRVYAGADFDAVLAGRTAVELRGVPTRADQVVRCGDVAATVEDLLRAEVVVWDGSPPSTMRSGPYADCGRFTAVLPLALEAAQARGQRLVIAGTTADHADAWRAVAEEFPGQVKLFEGAAPRGARVVSVGLGSGPLLEQFSEAVGAAVDWTIYPASVIDVQESLDQWGGMVLTTPCALRDRKLVALSGAWTLAQDALGEWQLE